MVQKIRELEQDKFKLEDEVNGLFQNYLNLVRLQIANLRIKIQMVERKTKEEREVDRKQRKEELNFFKRTNQQLKSQIEAIMTPGK